MNLISYISDPRIWKIVDSNQKAEETIKAPEEKVNISSKTDEPSGPLNEDQKENGAIVLMMMENFPGNRAGFYDSIV